jgi:cobalt-zinc-cadmium efflux system outer membrane protein
MRRFLLPIMAAIWLLSGGRTAPAAEVDGAPLTLAGAVERALKGRPELAGFQFIQRVQETRLAEAGLAPRPEVELLLEDALGTGVRSGVESAQTSLMLSQVLELRGKREGRQALVEAGSARLMSEHAARQLDVIAEVARRFVVVLEGQLRYDLAAESVRIAEASQAKVDERVQASRSPPAEAARAGVQLWDARLMLEDAEHELEIARHFLAAAIGEDAVRFGRAEGDLMSLRPVESFESLVARLPQTPDLLQFANEERVHDAEIRLAELQRRADPRLTLGARRYEQGNDVALVAGVTIPLFTARAAQPAIDRARAQRELAGSGREARQLRLQAQLFSALTQLQHELGLSQILRDELLPRLNTALEQATYAYERGRFSHLEWTQAQRELLEGRLRLMESAGRFHLLRIEIERLTGTGLAAAGESQ